MGRKSKAKRLERSERTAQAPPPVKRGGRRLWLLVAAGLIGVCALGAVSATFFTHRGGSSDQAHPKAAILDQLSSRTPNQDFANKASATLSGAGYNVEYYPGDSVNVDAYRNLADHGYKIVILRAHSAVPRTDLAISKDVDPAVTQRIMDQIGDDVLLFTSEPYDGKNYIDDQKGLRLFPVVYAGDDMSQTYFAASAGFIESNMQGEFDGTVIILMGCSSLATDKTAAAFIDRGASAVIGWSDTVSPEHTDAATNALLDRMLKDHLSPTAAVDKVNADLGPDPQYNSVLKAYPPAG